MKLIPKGRRALIKIDPETSVTKGGIHLPQSKSAERYRTGEVTAVSDKCHELQVGDRVAVNRFKADEHIFDGKTYQLTEEDDILFVYTHDIEVLEPGET